MTDKPTTANDNPPARPPYCDECGSTDVTMQEITLLEWKNGKLVEIRSDIEDEGFCRDCDDTVDIMWP